MNKPASKTKSAAQKKRIFLVEDHPVTRDGLALTINFQDDLIVCGQAEKASEARQKIPQSKPDLVIVDITLADGNGLDLIKDLALEHPGLSTIVLSTHDERIYAERALRAGARGYIMKQEPTATVLQKIRDVLNGETCVSDAMRSKLLRKLNTFRTDTASGIESLSDREVEVFRLLGEGHGTTRIANDLHVSVSTIETYRAHIKEKLGLANANELVTAAARWVASNA